ncbi:carboxy-terminal kinesin 2-like [Babylonia areolata]|uniref:carboxy-terminal kinesin 2-like n=1 Tax=Babylonia areolata TaxID=304850 RepID=UPI003FD63AF5
MESERKPLLTRNGLSKLPMPGSRLKPPQNFKRARSPEEEPQETEFKKTRLDEEEVQETFASCSSSISRLSSTSSVSGARPASKLTKPSTAQPHLKKSTSTATCSARTVTQPKPSADPIRKGPAMGQGTRKPVASRSATVVSRPPVPRPAASRPGASAASQKPAAGRTGAPSQTASVGGGKKRPAWDLKGRLQDMEAVLSQREASATSLQSQLQSYNQRIEQLENQKQQLSGDIAKRSQQTEKVSQENEGLRGQMRDLENEMDSMRRKLQREIEDLTFSKSSLERQNATLDGELSASRTEISGLKSSVAQLTSSQAKVNAELESTKLGLDQAFRDIRARDEEICELKEMLAEREATIEENQKKIRDHETVRRQLHNTIQELKGNIRVFCRVRPLIGEELMTSDGAIHHLNFPDPDNKVLEMDRLTEMSMNESTLYNNRRGNNKYEFSFDRVFQPENTQEEVFEEISQLVQSALDGYNVCIFAYGQTGSGKTYTMEGGSVRDEESMGMIPRAVSQIFATAQDLQDKGWQYKFSTSFVEIYNETIGDLLATSKDKSVKHEIRLGGRDSQVTVTNLTTVDVTSQVEIAKLLKQASENRAVAATKCNERSSRSHSIFMLHLAGHNSITSETCQGTLNLVDLAGSERLKDSGSEGKRLKETQAINKSLSHLGNVIMALGNKESHIPYRDSKLTHLLQNSLGGNSKTLMFVNISPKEENFSESLNSLRFATKVNQCNIGTAQKRSK